jgi:hypothetical protein
LEVQKFPPVERDLKERWPATSSLVSEQDVDRDVARNGGAVAELAAAVVAPALHPSRARQAAAGVRADGNRRVEAIALSMLADIAVDEGRVADAVSMLNESYRIVRELNDLLLIAAGVGRFASARAQADADPATLALSIFASLQGGLLLTQATQSLKPLEAALDGAMTVLHGTAAN